MKTTPASETGAPRALPAMSSISLKEILVPVDFSAGADEALRFAVDLARKFRASVTLLHVLEISQYAQYMTVYPDFVAQPLNVAELEANSQKVAEARLQEMVAVLRQEGVTAHAVVRAGYASPEILRTAEERGADCIVIPTHGYSGVTRFLLGSTTERVIRHAHCPVMVVRLKKTPAAG